VCLGRKATRNWCARDGTQHARRVLCAIFFGLFFISASQFSRHQLRWYYNNLRGSSCGERRKNKKFLFFRWWCVIKHSVMSHKSCDPPTLNTRRTHHHHQGQMVKRVAALFI
jgi:hypothetical protein